MSPQSVSDFIDAPDTSLLSSTPQTRDDNNFQALCDVSTTNDNASLDVSHKPVQDPVINYSKPKRQSRLPNKLKDFVNEISNLVGRNVAFNLFCFFFTLDYILFGRT